MITWKTFKQKLEQYPKLYLQFQYAANRQVNAAYHITEIKQAPITSVDCGGILNNWTEIIVQLWEPAGQLQERSMTVDKALSIIAMVEKALPLGADAIVKIEFGNDQFDTRQMQVRNISAQNEDLVVNLHPDSVQCKAVERGGSCGTPTTDELCCTPAQPKPELINLAVNDICCTPGSGCC